MEAFYRTTNKNYGDPWKVTDGTKPDFAEVPTHKDIGNSALDMRKAEKVLKNQLVAQKYSKKENEDILDELAATKLRFEQSAISSKPFPGSSAEYKIPPHGLKVGNAVYMTNYMDIGHLQPNSHEINSKFHPLNTDFTRQFSGGMTKNTSLNTATTLSKTHHAYDHLFSQR